MMTFILNFIPILVTLIIASLNWRIQLRHDYALEAYVRLKSALEFLNNSFNGIAKNGSQENAEFRIALIKDDLTPLLGLIRADKIKLAILYDKKVDNIYDIFDTLVNEYVISCLAIYSKNNTEEDLLLFRGEDEAYSIRIKNCNTNLDEAFEDMIHHPYIDYFCLKFNKCFP